MIISKKTIFLCFSNLSLISTKCLINKYKLKEYIIIFLAQDGDDNDAEKNSLELIKNLGLSKGKIFNIDKKCNYKLSNFYSFRKKINSIIKNFCDLNNSILITSINYGYVYYYFKLKLNQKDDYLIDEGITNWLEIKDRYVYIKSLIYSLLFLNFINLPKYRIIGNVNLKYYFGYLDNLNKSKLRKHYYYVSLLDEYKKIIKNNKVEIKLPKEVKNKDYYLLILAKNIHYKFGLNNLLEKTIELIEKNSKKDFLIIIKFHPGYNISKKEFQKKYYGKILIIKDKVFPIEFYDLDFIAKIFSPINSSLFLLNFLNVINKKKIFFYNVFQADLAQKLIIAKKFNFKEAKISELY